MQANMRFWTVRCLAAMLFLLVALQAMGRKDSMLWVGIKEVGLIYQQGQRDSAFVKANTLLTTAKQQEDNLAQVTLLNLIGVCMSDQHNDEAAFEAFAQCATIAERNNYLEWAVKTNNTLLFRTMLPAYCQLALLSKEAGRRAESAKYAKTGMAWEAECDIPATRVRALVSFGDILMAQKEYALLYEPLKRGALDAMKLKQVDFALTLITHIIIIERDGMHRQPEDIQWIKIGETLLPEAKKEASKSAFLAATRLTSPSPSQGGENLRTGDAPGKLSDDSLNQAKNDSIQTRIEYEYIKVRHERIGIIGGILALVLLIFGLYILWQRRQRKKASQKAEQQMKERYREGQEIERSRLAKELHDGVSNQLLAIEMKLQEDGLTPQTMQLISESREQVRRVSHELIPPEFEHATLDEVVRAYATNLDGTRHCAVSYTSKPQDADWASIPQATALEIYRIIQEITGNALKHADATMISIGMHLEKQSLTITISDNGSQTADRPKEPDNQGIGLRTIAERTASIGGEIEYYHHAFGNTVKLTVKGLQTAK